MIRSAFPLGLAAAALAVVGSACASTGQSSDPAALAGCYYFEQAGAATDLNLPWGVRLLDRPLEGWPALQQLDGVRLAITLTGREETDHPFGYWRPLPGDSVLVGYPAGGGLSLRLTPEEGGLTGLAQPLGDATLAAERPTTAVALVHARCPEDL